LVSSSSSAETFEADEHLDGEYPRLPRLVVGQLAAGLYDRPEPVHPSHVVDAVHPVVTVFEDQTTF
jgi:hypothetical protein